jgi:hypothetical protein
VKWKWLIVIEDTMGGICSVRAEELLQKAGFDVNVCVLGLTSGSVAKTEAFAQADVPRFENWESLISGCGL